MTKKQKKSQVGRKRKILFGSVDIGFRINQYEEFIRSHYEDIIVAESISIFMLPQTHYETEYTYHYSYFDKNIVVRYYLTFFNFLRLFTKYDTFHFLSGETLLTRRLLSLELWLFRLMGKRVVMNFVGADIRSVSYIEWKSNNLKDYLAGNDSFPKTEPFQEKLVRSAQKYADSILVSTPDLIDIIPEAKFSPVMIDLDRFFREFGEVNSATKADGDVVTILHVPSNVSMKGSKQIKEVLERFAAKTRNKIKLVLPEKRKSIDPNLPHTTTRYELFELYKSADIVIDQLVIGWYGLQSVEALAAGNEVICFIDEKFTKYLYPDCPINNADYNTLEKVLGECVEKILSKGIDREKNLEWVKKYHTIENNCSELLNAWNLPPR